MNNIDFFKLQAKNLYRDSKTLYTDDEGLEWFESKFFDLDEIILSRGLNEKEFADGLTLMKAQHLLSELAGFVSWNDLIHSSEARLELGRLIIESGDLSLLEDWRMYETQNLNGWSDESKLEVFKTLYLENETSS